MPEVPLFSGVPAIQGGSQHVCSLCNCHFHAACGQDLGLEAVQDQLVKLGVANAEIKEWCGCEDFFQGGCSKKKKKIGKAVTSTKSSAKAAFALMDAPLGNTKNKKDKGKKQLAPVSPASMKARKKELARLRQAKYRANKAKDTLAGKVEGHGHDPEYQAAIYRAGQP
eukprot:scaffold309115_cov37-Prasinocladus_malaysianus.AAC.1